MSTEEILYARHRIYLHRTTNRLKGLTIIYGPSELNENKRCFMCARFTALAFHLQKCAQFSNGIHFKGYMYPRIFINLIPLRESRDNVIADEYFYAAGILKWLFNMEKSIFSIIMNTIFKGILL